MMESNIPEETVSSEGESRSLSAWETKVKHRFLESWEDGDLILVVEDEKMFIKSQTIPQQVTNKYLFE